MSKNTKTSGNVRNLQSLFDKDSTPKPAKSQTQSKTCKRPSAGGEHEQVTRARNEDDTLDRSISRSQSGSLMNISKHSKTKVTNMIKPIDLFEGSTEADSKTTTDVIKPMTKPRKMKVDKKSQIESSNNDSGRDSFTSLDSSLSSKSVLSESQDKMYITEIGKHPKEKLVGNMSEEDTEWKDCEEELDTSCPVGFGTLPDQVYRKAVRKGFEFSLMVVGESGLGKSTLVNSMFLTNIYSRNYKTEEQTVQVEAHQAMLEENGVKLALTVVDTPGFGDAVDNTGCWEPIIEYVEKQFEDYLEEETKVDRVEVSDTRVHACLYFIAPTGHGLKQLDIQFLKRIHQKVNIIPVIGKADSCTRRELSLFKAKVLVQLERNEIQIYDFPESELRTETSWMRSLLPFAVVGSTTTLTDHVGNQYRGREYCWGTVNIEDKAQCDFMPLRHLVLATHMQDLKDVTHARHYQNFRKKKLNMMIGQQDDEVEDLEHENKSDDEKFESMNFDWEGALGQLTNERLEQLQRYARNQDYVKKLNLADLPHEADSIKRHRESFSGERKLWRKGSCQSLQEQRKDSLSRRRIKSLMSVIGAKVLK